MSIVTLKADFSTEVEADGYIEKTYHWYHPAGYGTSLTKTLRDGRWFVTGYRYSSCD
jgi:hypothetical protein